MTASATLIRIAGKDVHAFTRSGRSRQTFY
jgi:hypothetical protein